MNIQRRLNVLMIVLGMALLMPGVALAAHYTISTIDGSVTDWTGVVTTVTDGADAGVDDNWDIYQGWVANNSDQSEMYFRLSLVPGGVFPEANTGPYHYIEARVSCDANDGDIQEAGDIVVSYDLDYAGECLGTDWPACSTYYEAGSIYDGQFIAGSSYNYEFKADMDTDPDVYNVSWSSCTNDIWVTLATYDYTNNITYDTVTIPFNVPTAVKMNDISAHPKNEKQASLVLILAGALLITGQSIFRRKQA